MGNAAGVNRGPQSPYHKLCAEKMKKAKTTRYIDGEASKFYSACASGDINQVRQILEATNRESIDELVKLERNGDTALHAAVRGGHNEIVNLLLENECSRTILNRSGKVAFEEATIPGMQRLFSRSEASDRFHDSDLSKTITHYLPKTTKSNAARDKSNIVSPATHETNNPTTTANDQTLKFFQQFSSEEEIYRYSLNHQTTAMWLRFFNWFTRKFPNLLQRDDLNHESFQLHENADFNQFLEEKLGGEYHNTRKMFVKAHKDNSLDILLKIYTKEKGRFYKHLNQQLASSPAEADTTPHLCDRYIIEFHIRSDELAKRSFLGTTYRGATVNSDQVSSYEKLFNSNPRGVITFNGFTSTSEDKDVAISFIIGSPPKSHQTAVLFIFTIKHLSPTIVGIADISEHTYEKEILMMPGNLFTVQNVVKDVIHTGKCEQSIKLTEIHLEYLHIPVSFWKKLAHTYRSANNSVTSIDDDF